MECLVVVPHGTDVGVIKKEYPDLRDDDLAEDGDVYCIGKDADEESDDEWLTYDEAIEFCGFCEGAIELADAVIVGNGGWAMSMLSRTDFSGYSGTAEDIAELKRRSDIWHQAFNRGQRSRAS